MASVLEPRIATAVTSRRASGASERPVVESKASSVNSALAAQIRVEKASDLFWGDVVAIDLELSTVTFTALGDSISQLPPKVLKKVIHLYFEIGHVTNLHRQYLSINERAGLSLEKPGGKQKKVVEDELLPQNVAYLNLVIQVLNGTVERTISELQDVHAHLSKFATHWIKWKRWKKPAIDPVDYVREAQLLANQHAHNEQLMLALIEKQKREGVAP